MVSEAPSVKEFLKEKEFLTLSALVILFFYRPLFFETFFFRDLYLFIFPQKAHLAEMLKSGQMPLWDPFLHGGQPFLGNIHNTAMYPSGLLYLLLPPVQAFNTDIVLHLWLCAAGAYLFARVVSLTPLSSLIAGAVYGFCGYTLSFVNLFDRFLAVPYLPLLMLFWHSFLSVQKKKWFVMAVFAGFCQLLTGAAEMVMITFVSVLVWTVLYPYASSLSRRMIFYGLLVFFAGGLSSVQTIPAAEMLRQSTRGTGYLYSSFAAWSVHPKRLPEMILPGFLGYTDRISGRAYWGMSLEAQFPYVVSIYFGLTVLVLAWTGGIRGERGDGFPRVVRFCLLVVAALTLLLSLGAFLPFFYLVHEHVPLINRLRYPVKFLAAAVLPVALLSGYTSFSCFGDRSASKPSAATLSIFWLISVFLISFAIGFSFSEKFANWFAGLFFGESGKIVQHGLSVAFSHAAGIWVLFTLIFHDRRRQVRGWHHSAVAALILIDLLWAGQSVNPYAPRAFFTEEPNLANVVKKEIGDGRFLRMPNPGGIVLQMPADNNLYLARWNLETLENYTGASYQIPLIFHENFDGLAKREIAQMAELIHSVPWEQKLPLFSAANIRLVLTAEDLSVPGVEKLATVRNRSSRVFFLYRLINSAPRVGFVHDVISSMTDREILDAMTCSEFDPRKAVVLSGFHALSAGSCGPAQIQKIASGINAARFQVRNDCDGFLVFSEPYDSGWRVEIDGKREQLIRANFAFSAVPIKAGTHTVQRRYLPESLVWGSLSSLIFLGLLILTVRLKW